MESLDSWTGGLAGAGRGAEVPAAATGGGVDWAAWAQAADAPLRLDARPDGVRVPESEAFGWLLEAAAWARARNGAPAPADQPQILLYVGDGQIETDVLPLLPARSDGDAAGYAARVTRMLGGQAFGLQIVRAQTIPGVFDVAGTFFRAFYEQQGFGGTSVANLFFGTYRETPFGVHLDPELVHSFQLMLDGEKEFLFWPDAAVAADPELGRIRYSKVYASVRSMADRVGVGPGDVVYWPQRTWHVAEGRSPYHFGLTLAYSDAHRPYLSTMFAEAAGRHVPPVPFGLSDGAPDPEVLRTSLRHFARRLLGDDGQALARDVAAMWLRMQTSLAFWEMPPDRPGAEHLAPSDRWQLAPSPWRPMSVVDRGVRLVSASGAIASLAESDPLRCLWEGLVAGASVRLGDVPDQRALLEFLWARRAIVPASE